MSESYSGKPLKELSFLDYGAGNGLFSLFLKFCGAREVIAIDNNPDCTENIKILSDYFGLPVEGIYRGGEDSLKDLPFRPDLLIGTDVIEHIYDIDAWFSLMASMPSLKLLLFTTGSNPCNPLKLVKLWNLQWKDEYKGEAGDFFVRQTAETGSPFLSVRKEIIRNNFNTLNDTEINKLARLTRGKNKTDILAVVNKFVESGEWPAAPADFFSTCDPVTGSWTERILSLTTYAKLAGKYNFHFEKEWLLYDSYFPSRTRWLKAGINLLIQKLPVIAGTVSPGILLIFQKEKPA